jgi:hypothetical protein
MMGANGRDAHIAAGRQPRGEWVELTQGDIGTDTATIHCDPNSEHSVSQGELLLTERAFLLSRPPDSRGPIRRTLCTERRASIKTVRTL